MKAPVCVVTDFICHCQSKFIATENSLFDGRMSNRHGHVLAAGRESASLMTLSMSSRLGAEIDSWLR